MTTLQKIVRNILQGQPQTPQKTQATAFAPANIALIKYWGKRDATLRLPVTSSLSLDLGKNGVTTTLSPLEAASEDQLIVNGQPMALTTDFARRVIAFLALFDFHERYNLRINTTANIPISAGLASSAAGFAALVKALAALFQWSLTTKELSILARLGSGSAARSIETGFVVWHQATDPLGMDSYAKKVAPAWPTLCLGILLLEKKTKSLGSTQAMEQSKTSSPLYPLWPALVQQHLESMRQAIQTQNIHQLGSIAEQNALCMHTTMTTAQPAVCYTSEETLKAIHTVWQLRQQGIPLYYTQDAGPNVVLLFEKKSFTTVQQQFPAIQVVSFV